jgi:hypothetical protein
MNQINKIITNFRIISIPNYLLYESDIKYNDLINKWIEYRKNEPICNKLLEPQSGIPEDLKYPGWKTNKNSWNETPLMLWIRFRKHELIPEDLKYPGWETDRNNWYET